MKPALSVTPVQADVAAPKRRARKPLVLGSMFVVMPGMRALLAQAAKEGRRVTATYDGLQITLSVEPT